jgi:hypothetical protein
MWTKMPNFKFSFQPCAQVCPDRQMRWDYEKMGKEEGEAQIGQAHGNKIPQWGFFFEVVFD